MVDEIRDLVADRARLMLALVSGIGGGYALAGDPARSIYDFQLTELEDDSDSRGFLARLTSLNAKAPSLIRLSRALSEESRMALSVGTALADPDIDGNRVQFDLSKSMDRLDGIRSRDLAARLRKCASKDSRGDRSVRCGLASVKRWRTRRPRHPSGLVLP